MKIYQLSFYRHVDIAPKLFVEIKLNVNEEKLIQAMENGQVDAELWIIDEELDEKFMHNELFFLSAEDTPFSLVDANLYRILKGYRKKGLPASRILGYEKEYRWMYYEREFGAVIPVLEQWDHAYWNLTLKGCASCGAEFVYDNQKVPLPLCVGNTDCNFFYPIVNLKKWIDELDNYITKIYEAHKNVGKEL